MTYVTCPIRRYRSAVVAQKAATMQLLSDGRFTLGLGAGENLNEHIIGGHVALIHVGADTQEEFIAWPQRCSFPPSASDDRYRVVGWLTIWRARSTRDD